MRRKDVPNKTKEILQNDIYSRENDGYLQSEVIGKLEPELAKKDFKTVMRNLQNVGISMESITRARRKFFEDNPELKIDKAEKARRESLRSILSSFLSRVSSFCWILLS